MSSQKGYPGPEALEGNSEVAFSALYDTYWERLFRYIIRVLPDEEEVADVVQETFVTFWELRSRHNRVRSVKAYLFIIGRNLAFKRFRERAKEADFADRLVKHYGTANENTSETLYRKELNEWFDREVARLPERMREVFVLSRKEQLSYKEIAERLNISDQTVKKQINKSLKLLRLKLDEEYIPYLLMLLFVDLFS